ncbi:BPI fold-containing family B member 3-like [Paroedura picta]|uniref:BPI fold-containing family B member 3-like n=1 Tax=Paroedura picta TaxID=143630 RepID=UPI0040568FD7
MNYSFSLQNSIFKAMFSASNGKLIISLSQNRFDIVQASSSMGSSNAQKLHDWLSGIYMNSYLPAMNGMLSKGITLPSILNDKWIKANTAFSQDGLVILM